jgi:hypothetical protein
MPEPGCWCDVDPETCAIHNPQRQKQAHGHFVPVWALAAQVVEIHWRLADGSIVVERHAAPDQK